jgi:hypothetical protein
MLTKRQLEDAAKCKSNEACMTCRAWNIEYDGMFDCIERLAQTALALADMLEEITDTLDTVTDIIDESGEWGNINAQTTIETLDKAKALLKESEGEEG